MSCAQLLPWAIHQSMFAAFTGLRSIALDLEGCSSVRVHLLSSAFVGMHHLEEVSFSSTVLYRETILAIYKVISTHLPNLKHLTLATRSIGEGSTFRTLPFTLLKLRSLRFSDELLRTPEFQVFLGRLKAPCLGSVTIAQWSNMRTDARLFPSHLSFGIEHLYLVQTRHSSSFTHSPIGLAFPALKSLTLIDEEDGRALGILGDFSLPNTIEELCIKGPDYVVLNSVTREIGEGGLSNLKKLVIDIGTSRTAGQTELRMRHMIPQTTGLQRMLDGRGVSIILQGFQISWTTDGEAIGEMRGRKYR